MSRQSLRIRACSGAVQRDAGECVGFNLPNTLILLRSTIRAGTDSGSPSCVARNPKDAGVQVNRRFLKTFQTAWGRFYIASMPDRLPIGVPAAATSSGRYSYACKIALCQFQPLSWLKLFERI
jgi:hypothetical protein